MNILDKIEEIRKKPEHIRLRYAWFFTAISMFMIILIWALSLKSQLPDPNNQPLTQQQENILNEFQDQKKSLKEAADGIKDAYDKSTQIQTQNSEGVSQEEGFGQ